MKKLLVLTAAALVSTAAFAKTTVYKVNTEESTVEWVGKKVTGQHNGTISIKEGTIQVTDGEISGGEILIDMTSITVLDLKGDSKGKLEGHLKSDDFFGVKTHPIAKFKIKKTTDEGVMGDLTIKKNTHPLTIDAAVEIDGNTLMAEASEVTIDRSQYDVRYGSDKFFDNLGDKVIYDDFTLSISLVAGKK